MSLKCKQNELVELDVLPWFEEEKGFVSQRYFVLVSRYSICSYSYSDSEDFDGIEVHQNSWGQITE
jgi:hypothetical protein